MTHVVFARPRGGPMKWRAIPFPSYKRAARYSRWLKRTHGDRWEVTPPRRNNRQRPLDGPTAIRRRLDELKGDRPSVYPDLTDS